MSQKLRRQDPWPWTWELSVGIVVVVLVLAMFGDHLGRAIANVLAGGGLHFPARVDFFTCLPAVLRGERRNAARWAIALSLGLRQGEVLGLHWSDVDLEAGSLKITTNRVRPHYEHGCSTPCGRTPGHCTRRVQTNEDDGPTKSSAGKRKIGLPPQLVQLLEDHRREQDQERATAGPLWVETGRVFTDRFGRAVKPNSDYHAWKALLERAGVRETRLHDARHTAATVLLAPEVPERTVMGVMGWSSTSMAARYQHLTDPIRHEVASRVGGLLWSPVETN